MIGYFVVATIILAIILVIPYGITKITKSELQDKEFRELFWREAGWRGRRISATLGCFLPLSFISGLPPNKESILFMLLFISYCFFEHLKLYKGVQIFNPKIIGYLAGLIFFQITLNLLTKFDVINYYFSMFLISISCLFWGWFINITRTRIIAIEQNIEVGEIA